MSKRAELRSTKDNIDILTRMSERLINGQRELTRAQSLEFGRALSDIAERLERAADVLARLMQLSNPATTLQDVHLTPREMEIFGYLADGQTNGEIASRCWVSENTVKFHLKNIFRKLGIRDRGQAMMIAKGLRHSINGPGAADGSTGK
jgi:DNA-binding CsgD family transcriptional regulator